MKHIRSSWAAIASRVPCHAYVRAAPPFLQALGWGKPRGRPLVRTQRKRAVYVPKTRPDLVYVIVTRNTPTFVTAPATALLGELAMARSYSRDVHGYGASSYGAYSNCKFSSPALFNTDAKFFVFFRWRQLRRDKSRATADLPVPRLLQAVLQRELWSSPRLLRQIPRQRIQPTLRWIRGTRCVSLCAHALLKIAVCKFQFRKQHNNIVNIKMDIVHLNCCVMAKCCRFKCAIIDTIQETCG